MEKMNAGLPGVKGMGDILGFNGVPLLCDLCDVPIKREPNGVMGIYGTAPLKGSNCCRGCYSNKVVVARQIRQSLCKLDLAPSVMFAICKALEDLGKEK